MFQMMLIGAAAFTMVASPIPTKSDEALWCRDPESIGEYRTPASDPTNDHHWVYLIRSDAFDCHVKADDQSKCTKLWGCYHTHRDGVGHYWHH